MQVTGIDTRDVQSELNEPDFRVHFFEPDGRSDEYQLSRAREVAEVLDWAKANVGDRTYIVYVFIDFGPSNEKPSLIRLLGRDPNEAPAS